jgi:hypothetical protein
MEPRLPRYLPDPPLTRSFVESKVEPGWGDLAWLAANPWLPYEDILDLADGLAEDEPSLRVEIALAADDAPSLAAILDRQATLVGSPQLEIRDRWMHLAVTSALRAPRRGERSLADS